MKPRVVLAGNNLAAVYTLDLLLEAAPADHTLVIAPASAARASWHASLGDHAKRRGVQVLAPESVNAAEVVDAVAAHGPDLLLSVYYTQIFRDLLTALDGRPALNVHPSLLPRHRGVAPLVWAIAEGDRLAGVTVHHVAEHVDEGRIVEQRSLPIHPDDTGYTLHLKAARLVRAVAAQLIRALADGAEVPEGTEQRGVATHHRRSDPPLNHLDWSQGRRRIRDVVRALAPPLPGAHAELRGERLVIARVEPAEGAATPLPPGMVQVSAGRPLVWAADGPVAIVEYAAEDGSLRPGTDLVAAGTIAEGDVLA